jgi:hypothetical protein
VFHVTKRDGVTPSPFADAGLVSEDRPEINDRSDLIRMDVIQCLTASNDRDVSKESMSNSCCQVKEI